MDCFHGVLVLAENSNRRPSWRFFPLIPNLIPQLAHRRSAWRIRVVNKHGHIEISRRKQFRDVGQVHANLFAALGIVRIVCRHLNRATRWSEPKVVGRCLVRKAHRMIASGDHTRVVVRSLLPRQDEQNQQNKFQGVTVESLDSAIFKNGSWPRSSLATPHRFHQL